MLSERQRRLYARHVLLPEIGMTGQQRLCATQRSLPDTADPRAAGVAAMYLARAGISLSEQAQPMAPLPDPEDVTRLAGATGLEQAAAAVAGALAAVETIKAALGIETDADAPAGEHTPAAERN